jgi:predicted kinase
MNESTQHNQSAQQHHLVLITGNMASGKSSVAQGLAQRLPYSVHVRGDAFRRMIVNGRAEMGSVLSSEAEHQLHLRYRIATNVARAYFEAGFNVVLQDVIIGSGLTTVLTHLQGLPLTTIVLCPRPEIIAARDQAREKTAYGDLNTVLAFDRILREDTPRLGTWIDSSDQSVPETVDHILRLLSAGAP